MPQGQGDGRALGEVLNPHANGQGHGAGVQGGVVAVLGGQGKGKAHRHALGDVVQRHGENQQRGALPGGGAALGLLGAQVQVGHEIIHGQEEQHPQHKAPRRREPPRQAAVLRLLDSRDEQAPHCGRHHDARGKAQENPLGPGGHSLAEEKHHRGPQGGHQAGKARPPGGPQHWLHRTPSFCKKHFQNHGIFSPAIIQGMPPFVKQAHSTAPAPASQHNVLRMLRDCLSHVPVSSRMELKKPCLSASTPTSRYIEKGRREMAAAFLFLLRGRVTAPNPPAPRPACRCPHRQPPPPPWGKPRSCPPGGH